MTIQKKVPSKNSVRMFPLKLKDDFHSLENVERAVKIPFREANS
jgi:hypothetical protein